ncbi:DUF5996 family protein [Anaeromyxobacter oryzisoli]|uniref:DUF5996 family protein n=1 Tax=Anaeromyxobacter oryzisoli TaxID=2925408 RepID=UPI001F5A5451|nr:DUF5996 family protein [Anaeromyxobacter sp. SG63]
MDPTASGETGAEPRRTEVQAAGAEARWPPLPLAGWRDTCDTLHLWTQVVGKVRLALTPLENHWWNVPLYLTARGLTTSPMPVGDDVLEIAFDFVEHALRLDLSDGRERRVPLRPMTVAAFHRELMAALDELGCPVRIDSKPCEIPEADKIRFEQDTVHAAYDAGAVHRFWRILLATRAVLQVFRGGFVGKASPIQFYWGSFDLALTFFSGRRAPPRPNAGPITREAYSHEVASFGWWPGTGDQDAAFYAYAAPEPAGFANGTVSPAAARYDPRFHEYLLDYEAVRTGGQPDDDLLAFFASTYARAATLGKWDRAALER